MSPASPIVPQDRPDAKAGIFGRRSARWPLSLSSAALAISAAALILSAGQASADPGLVLTPTELEISEAASGTYGVKLAEAPTATVTVSVTLSAPYWSNASNFVKIDTDSDDGRKPVDPDLYADQLEYSDRA